MTRAYDEWRLTDWEIRSFLKLAVRFATQAYDHLWQAASHEPAFDDSPDLVDVFTERVDGIWPHDFEWMLLSGGVKDAVTAFEVYLEKVREEVLRRHGFTARPYTDERSLKWHEVTDFFKDALGVHVSGDDKLRNVRRLRHILTHKRGELRTEEQRRTFGITPERWMGIQATLSLDRVLKQMDTLATSVEKVDRVAYEAAWGRTRHRGAINDYVTRLGRPRASRSQSD